MEAVNALLLLFILLCALCVSLTKSLLAAVIIFMAQSLVMSVVWILLRSPDLAITEAAVGAAVIGGEGGVRPGVAGLDRHRQGKPVG